MSIKKPNILLIMADQLAAPALPIYGHKQVIAPNIDKLAENSVIFDNCYCNFPMCGPSRSSLHSSIYPHKMNCFDNASEFQANIPTLPHYLRSIGYKTLLSGKMHFVGPDQLHGYEKRLTTEIYPANFAWTVDWSKGREFRPTNLTMAPVIESGPCERTLQIDYDDEVAYHSIQGIYDLARSSDDKPFFLTVSFTHPHSPFVISQKYWDLYNHDDIIMPTVDDIPPDQRDILSENLYYCQARHKFSVTYEHVRNARHAYYGMISYIDNKIGQILNTLEKTNLKDNTIIIFCADHGEMMGERGMWYKQHFWEWASKIPFVFYFPSRFKPKRIKENVSLVDLMPTILEIVDDEDKINFVSKIDGRSFLNLLKGDSRNWNNYAISEFSADGSTGPSRMIKKENCKYMYLEDVDELLYDLANDPNETNNLINDKRYEKQISEMKEIIFNDWNFDEVKNRAIENQKNRLFIHKVTKGDPTYVNLVKFDDDKRYIRNAGAADTKAKARFPYVEPAKPDKKL